jgi:dTDP-4-amino-4,6-dideoxygalactose transaminase
MDKLAIHGGSPVRNEFIVYGSPDIGEDEIREVVDSLQTGWLSTGPKVVRFENDVKEYTGAAQAVATNSCTAALHLSLLLSGIGKGDQVITTPLTFGATANVIEHIGAIPVLADVSMDTYTIDPANIEKKITPKTKAIIPVHYAGYPCAMDQIKNIADQHGLIVIEDAAHALGTKYKGRMIGNGENISCFSFYVTKNVAMGEGGMIMLNKKDLAERMRVLGLHGMDHGAWQRYTKIDTIHYGIVFPGYKYNMQDLNAAIGIHQLKRLEGFIARKKQLANMYYELLRDEESLILPPRLSEQDGSRSSWHIFPVLIKPETVLVTREEIMRAIIEENVGVATHYRAIFEQPYYKDKYAFNPVDYPNANFVSKRVFSIPLQTKMTEQDLMDVVTALRKVLAYYKK